LSSGSLQLAREGRRVWRYDSRPARDGTSRVQIGMGGEPARPAQESRLRAPIGLLTLPTTAALLAGVGRVDRDHWPARQRRLVGAEGPHLQEGPTVQHSPLAFPTVPFARSPMPLRSSRAIPREVPFAVCTMALLLQWLISQLNRFSRLLRLRI